MGETNTTLLNCSRTVWRGPGLLSPVRLCSELNSFGVDLVQRADATSDVESWSTDCHVVCTSDAVWHKGIKSRSSKQSRFAIRADELKFSPREQGNTIKWCGVPHFSSRTHTHTHTHTHTQGDTTHILNRAVSSSGIRRTKISSCLSFNSESDDLSGDQATLSGRGRTGFGQGTCWVRN